MIVTIENHGINITTKCEYKRIWALLHCSCPWLVHNSISIDQVCPNRLSLAYTWTTSVSPFVVVFHPLFWSFTNTRQSFPLLSSSYLRSSSLWFPLPISMVICRCSLSFLPEKRVPAVLYYCVAAIVCFQTFETKTNGRDYRYPTRSGGRDIQNGEKTQWKT